MDIVARCVAQRKNTKGKRRGHQVYVYKIVSEKTNFNPIQHSKYWRSLFLRFLPWMQSINQSETKLGRGKPSQNRFTVFNQLIKKCQVFYYDGSRSFLKKRTLKKWLSASQISKQVSTRELIKMQESYKVVQVQSCSIRLSVSWTS